MVEIWRYIKKESFAKHELMPVDAHLEFAPGEVIGDIPTIFTALQEQLELRLVSAKGPVEVLAIDRVERPSEN